MRVSIGPRPPLAGKFFALRRDQPASSHYLCGVMMRDPRLREGGYWTWDAGKSRAMCRGFIQLISWPVSWTGVDPFPGVMNHPWLTEKWCGEFDTAPIPPNTYDAMLSINVVEHVQNPRTFLLAAIWRGFKPKAGLSTP